MFFKIFKFLVRPPTVQLCKQKLSNLEPVKLAYASYESTAAPSDKDPAPLLVNHGIFGSKSNWNSLCKVYHQKTGRKIIAVDSRNHGDSPHASEHTYEHLVLDLKELLKELKIEKTALLGHSMGGRAVMYFALKYSHFVDRMIVADISPIAKTSDLRAIPRIFNVLQNVKLPKNVSLSIARLQTDAELARFIRDKSLRNFLLTNLVQKLDGTYMWRINIPTLVANFENISAFPSTNLKYEGPVLFIGGGESDMIRSDHKKILKVFPKAEFKYISGAGHWLHIERPTDFLNYTIEFLNKLYN